FTFQDVCQSNPCLNGGSCSIQSVQENTYTCLCLPRFSGLNCELGKDHDDAVAKTCYLENGGCEHFCDEDEETQSVNCSCADGYFLSADGRSCFGWSLDSLDPRARIVGGSVCPKGECPWQVLLLYKGKGFCGGVLFRPWWVLTASHCLENMDVQTLNPGLCLAGEHDTDVAEGTEQLVQVSQILMHEDYVTATADNDIALLRLATPIAYTPYAVPACLPTRALAERDLWAVNKHTVSGWGRRTENGPTSHLLRRLLVPNVRTQDCVEWSGVRITANMFCAGYIEGREDSCKGDSGGPLVTKYKNTTFLLGIVSWGKGCARPGHYGIYTRVSNYLDWIHNRTTTGDQLTNRTQEVPQNPDKEVPQNPTNPDKEVPQNPTN
uniref:Coagulation factor VII n=1 Tax=Sphaeramia orbicularis TaxID=375764 RepID=A0A672YQF9_9TELE